jgi:predicted AAA+ superfamily ATPase
LYPNQDLNQVFLLFDEIQEIPNWEKFIRWVTDTLSGNVFLTGSNAKLLSREIATSLRGRSLNFEIQPLSFREYLIFQDIPKDDVISSRNRAKVNNAFTAGKRYLGTTNCMLLVDSVQKGIKVPNWVKVKPDQCLTSPPRLCGEYRSSRHF